MARPRCSIALACIALLVRPPPTAAQSLEEALKSCAAEADDQKRLACYDRSMAAQLAPSSPAAKPAATGAAATPPVASSVGAAPVPAPGAPAVAAAPAAAPGAAGAGAAAASEFGVRSGPLAVHRSDNEPKEITAAVIGIQQRGSGVRVLALDNGQSWVENDVTDLSLNIGDRVRIRAAALGSYMLYTPTKRFTHVTRIR